MYTIKRILVALDLSDQDEVLLRYLSRLAQIRDLDKVYFLHVSPTLDIPGRILEKYPDLLVPADESIRQNIDFACNRFLELPAGVEQEVLVSQGQVVEQLVRTARQKLIDLVVMGRKNDAVARLSLVRKAVRSAPCSVALIPEQIPNDLHSVLVPIDFSENSLMALEQARFLAEKFPELTVKCLHIYDVPSGYSKTGKSYTEFAEVMKQNAQSECEEFLHHHGLSREGMEFHFLLRKDQDLPKLINQFAISSQANAIVVGSKGRTAFAAMLMGSVAERLVENDQYLPLFVIKDKKAQMDWWDAAMQI
ncbi:MAG: universal stress protein [Cytophagales bacterium]|nr:universal stress protein [Cytophagales bacterium]